MKTCLKVHFLMKMKLALIWLSSSSLPSPSLVYFVDLFWLTQSTDRRSQRNRMRTMTWKKLSQSGNNSMNKMTKMKMKMKMMTMKRMMS